jgi:hypothetical protein
MEDRRPAANMDPYVVCSMIFETTSILWAEKNREMRVLWVNFSKG